MKAYVKPVIQRKEYIPARTVATLDSWLRSYELTDAGITTYVINS